MSLVRLSFEKEIVCFICFIPSSILTQLWEIGQTKGFTIQATSHHIFCQAELAIFRNFSLQQIASPSAWRSFEKRACSFWFIWQSANCTFHPRLCLRWVRVWFGKLSTMHYALCTLLYALCTMHYALCTMKHSWARVWFGKLPQFRRDSNTLWTRRPLCVRETDPPSPLPTPT